MDHFNPKEVCRSYDLAALMNNIKDIQEDGELDENQEEKPNGKNSLVGRDPSSKKVYPVEIRLEELEERGSDDLDWEGDLLKIVESCESNKSIDINEEKDLKHPIKPFAEDSTQNQVRSIKQPSDNRLVDIACPILIGVGEINKIVGILEFFNLYHDIDYNLEGDERGMIMIKKAGASNNGSSAINNTSSTSQSDNKLFNGVMEMINRGIRIKKKYGKGFLKIDAENLPITHHEIHGIIQRMDQNLETTDGLRLLLKKAKGTRSMVKSMDLDNIILL
ncbi:polymerase-associated protein [Malakal virus]|uniref:Polymerase-associated protein n=1 Tax=Malakal virus TaxID=1229186 RepID=J9UGZ1_9RHAB|nr:polymerase-associated protein [Malakal virus]AFR67109.1 polymerase-associated protein [Malakal virus]